MPESRDPIDWIKHLDGPEPPANAPDWDTPLPAPLWRSGPAVGTVLALAAAMLLYVSLPTDDGTRFRGGEGAVDVDLRIVALTDQGPQRLRKGHTYATGQALAFRVGATPASAISVWAEGPGGRVELGAHDSTPTPADLTNAEGLVSLTLDAAGQWTVFASSAATGVCPPDACVFRAVDIGESTE